MRRVRIVISGMGTAVPTLVAFVLPAIDACGSGGEIIDVSTDGTIQDAKKNDAADGFVFPDSSNDAPNNTDAPPCPECTFTVPVANGWYARRRPSQVASAMAYHRRKRSTSAADLVPPRLHRPCRRAGRLASYPGRRSRGRGC